MMEIKTETYITTKIARAVFDGTGSSSITTTVVLPKDAHMCIIKAIDYQKDVGTDDDNMYELWCDKISSDSVAYFRQTVSSMSEAVEFKFKFNIFPSGQYIFKITNNGASATLTNANLCIVLEFWS